ncbi:hypothetical protein [Embleya hyalina]|uniref:hypothetical protein n=1 Tax=Embleya hyalina TaxID=516124 RepID=UPI000F82D198|nr:hypothetical protein [Embleya hyalina]
MIGAVIVGVIVILVWWVLSGDDNKNDKKKNASSTVSPGASGSADPSARASGTAVPSPTSTVKMAVIARQAIGLEIREKPGKGKTVTEVSAGTQLTATCRAKGGVTVYGWRGGKSDQWVLVTTSQGVGYAPEAWLETTGSVKDLLPMC